MSKVNILYFSDLLCIWAYIADKRLEELANNLGSAIEIDAHYCSVFPDAWAKIKTNWKSRGGFEGFSRHTNDVAARFPEIKVHERIWLDTRPRTSASGHLFLKAIQLLEDEIGDEDKNPVPYLDRASTKVATRLRHAFFRDGKDISDWNIHKDIADSIKIKYAKIEEKIRSAEAITQLAADYDLSQKMSVQGSPTLIMNEGRQKLFGNVGYRLIEANVKELLRSPADDEASWC